MNPTLPKKDKNYFGYLLGGLALSGAGAALSKKASSSGGSGGSSGG